VNTIRPRQSPGDDLIVWPDGTMCFASELDEYQHMSDDFERVAYSSDRWAFLVEEAL